MEIYSIVSIPTTNQNECLTALKADLMIKSDIIVLLVSFRATGRCEQLYLARLRLFHH